jgi:SAM-dependent methyltransferase
MTESQNDPHGGENLEVMREAENYNRFLRELVRQHSGGATSALDFGAGLGTFSDSLPIPAEKVTCVETEVHAQAVLRSKGFTVHADLSAVPDQSVPYLFSLNVLEHIDDDAAVASEFFRVLQPGGTAFIYVPAFEVLFTSMDRQVGHVRRYRRKQLVDRIKSAGLDVHYSAYTDALGFFATLAYRLLDDGEPKPLGGKLVRVYDRFIFPISRLLSVPCARLFGKNVMLAATRPG